jgi:hypothetical protein
MLRSFLVCLGLFSVFALSAQVKTKYDFHPCGSGDDLSFEAPHPSELMGYRTDTILYVPLTLHLTGTDAGLGHFPLKNLFNAVCRLNADYAESGIQFFWEGDIEYIDSSFLHQHDHVNVGGQMMLNHNVTNTVNSYFCADPAGNCGYNLPWALGVANSISCSGPNDHTWAHEIGHYLKLPHPFRGWESIQYIPGSTAPLTQTQDAYTFFQSEPVWNLDSSIMQTYEVEKMDSTNCITASDNFCDTRPDYLSYRWPCDANNLSTVTQTDPNGATFKSDGTLFMSYAYDECQSRFSGDEIARMRWTIYNLYPGLLYNQTPGEQVAAALAEIDSPTQLDTISSNGCQLTWNTVPGATHYIVEVSRFQSFSALVSEYLVTENALFLPNLDDNKNYYTHVRAISRWDACTSFGATRTFHASSNVSGATQTQLLETWSVFPNPASDRLTCRSIEAGSITMFNSLAQPVGEWSKDLGSDLHIELPENLPAGHYLVRFDTRDGFSTRWVELR